jgi:putative zinc finger/helix-turn-helix YgiT family protein
MPPKQQREPKERPFPWRCSDCFTYTVVPTVTDYTAKVKQDGVVHELYLPGIEIPRCQTCGGLTITSTVDELVNDALREHLRLLTPAQIRRGIEQLGLKQQEAAERLGVAPETISRWVNGALIQSRAMDNLLRLFFALPEAREVLQGPSQDPRLGIVDDPKPRVRGTSRISASIWRQTDEKKANSLRKKSELFQLYSVGNN